MLSEKYIKVNPKESSAPEIYKLLIGSIVPRPIALISTVSSKGIGNVAPFSFFNGVCSNPPSVMVSIARKQNGEKKDTLINIEETGEFVINSANKWLIEKLVHTAAEYDYGIDELKKSGLSALSSELVKPLRVRESAFQMECQLYDKLEVGDGSPGSATIIVGEVKLFHISQDIYRDGKISLEDYQPIARLGGINYCSVGEQLSFKVPKV